MSDLVVAPSRARNRRVPASVLRFIHNAEGRIAASIIIVELLVVFVGSTLLPYGPNHVDTNAVLQAPGAAHILGTDQLGRDEFSRIAAGIPVAIYVALASVLIALVPGTILGLVAGFLGGPVDLVIGWFVDVMFALPALLLALVVVSVFGPGVNNAILAVGIVYVPRFARIARGSAISVRHRLFIESARLSGRRSDQIMREHVLPNILGPVIVQTALSLSTAEIAHSSLSFLGLGIQPPGADLGTMLADVRGLITIAPWLTVFPAIALILIIVAFNLLGDALRDLMDPHRRVGTE